MPTALDDVCRNKALAMTNLPLDIVELEYLGPPDRESILSKGRLVHERSRST